MKKSVSWFFILVYVLSAPFWLIQLFINKTNLPLDIPITDIIAAFTPMISACIIVYNEKGRKGVLILLSRIADYKKISTKWWFVVVLLPFLIFTIIYLLLVLGNCQIPEHWMFLYLGIPFLLLFFFLGAIGEEVGYMGYAVDRLQKKYSALYTSVIVGILWIIWHYPSMTQQGRSLNFFFWGTLGTIAFRILLVWLYNNTNKSLFACILTHSLYNTGRVLFPADTIINPLVKYPEIHYSAIVVIALVVTCFWGYRTLNRPVIKI
ncbi:MAG TPA: type II CAAX endopeptidase family protein [Sphingobacteriaceae bacterium]